MNAPDNLSLLTPGVAREATVDVPAVIVTAVYEFQVFYRPPGPGRNLDFVLVRAETAEQARAIIEQEDAETGQRSMDVVSVGPGIPMVDWSRPYFTRDEVEAWARCSSGKISTAIARGLLKCSPERKVWSRKAIEQWLEGGKS